MQYFGCKINGSVCWAAIYKREYSRYCFIAAGERPALAALCSKADTTKVSKGTGFVRHEFPVRAELGLQDQWEHLRGCHR